MLYDNSQLARVYLHATQAADSQGVEGKLFVWTPDEIRAVLGSAADVFMAAYDIKGHTAAYVCRVFTCQTPTTEPEKLQAQLGPP
jgi:uncharacterized protein YyaL (SSP411 family)